MFPDLLCVCARRQHTQTGSQKLQKTLISPNEAKANPGLDVQANPKTGTGMSAVAKVRSLVVLRSTPRPLGRPPLSEHGLEGTIP